MQCKIYSLREFQDFDSAYWGIGPGSDGNIYFGLCSHLPGKSAGFFRFNPSTQAIQHLFNLDAVLGSIHGKIHTPIIEAANCKIFFGTHFAYAFGLPTRDVNYEGGHLLSFDLNDGSVRDFGIAHENEGILTLTSSSAQSKIYMLTIPGGYLIEADLSTGVYREITKLPSNGSICRTIASDNFGRVYGSYEDNGLFIYDPKSDDLALKANFFPEERIEEWASPSRGGVNKIGRKLWRCATYDPANNAIYGVYGSSRSFKIDCMNLSLEIQGELVPNDFGSSEDIYPTLSLVSNTENLFYAPANGMFDYCRSEHICSASHLMELKKQLMQSKDMGELRVGERKVLGVAGATLRENGLYFIGAVESDRPRSRSSKADELFFIDQTPFDLALIKVTP